MCLLLTVPLTHVTVPSQVCLVEGLARRQKGPNGSGWYERAKAIATAAETAFQAAAADCGLPPLELCCHSPETESWGTHHSKAFLLGYADGGVRVIVHTANLVVGDCNWKTQGVWWQDFPPKQQQGQGQGQQQQQGRRQPVSEFERTLSAYLHSLKLPGPWGQRMQQLVAGADFSAARGVLIGSVPGRHEGGKGWACKTGGEIEHGSNPELRGSVQIVSRQIIICSLQRPTLPWSPAAVGHTKCSRRVGGTS